MKRWVFYKIFGCLQEEALNMLFFGLFYLMGRHFIYRHFFHLVAINHVPYLYPEMKTIAE